ncbi:tRNA (adenosine(37)-N6)-threonylcarbamoyltransferase complex ATPase subunit type 1 TsaE [bacterium endosymbiont of Escarpia laminata]|nr:MAG: tRNA (adenosine(37)-N6)-threonylcarbamoyltransferase complex ATPase subunit type 1 TsaE [bacterium endosymbiont of Escarpia laminata]
MRLELHNEAEQESFGARLAKRCKPPFTVYLEGNLGTGKTTLARGFIRALGHQGAVKSPTYTLLEPYELEGVACYHFDLYRLADPEELEYLGIQDLMDGKAILLVEWPDRGKGVLPPADLRIRLEYQETGRVLQLSSHSEKGKQLIKDLQRV